MGDPILIYLKFNTDIFQKRKIFILFLNFKRNLLQARVPQPGLLPLAIQDSSGDFG